jgi:hypothetical protein
MIEQVVLQEAIRQQAVENDKRRAAYAVLEDEETRQRRTERVRRLLACCTREYVLQRLAHYGAVAENRAVLFSENALGPDRDYNHEMEKLVQTPLKDLNIDHRALITTFQCTLDSSVFQLLEALLPRGYRLYAMYGRDVNTAQYGSFLCYQITARTGECWRNDPLVYLCCQPLCTTEGYLDLVEILMCSCGLCFCCCLCCPSQYAWWAGP